jgi:hypothetical protein
MIILIDEDRLTDHPNLANSGYRGHRSRSVAASVILATAHVHPRWRPRHHAVTPCHRPVLAHSNATAHSHMLHRCSHALLPYPLVGQARLPNNWAEPCRVARLYGRLLLDLDRTNYEFMDQSVNVFFFNSKVGRVRHQKSLASFCNRPATGPPFFFRFRLQKKMP